MTKHLIELSDEELQYTIDALQPHVNELRIGMRYVRGEFSISRWLRMSTLDRLLTKLRDQRGAVSTTGADERTTFVPHSTPFLEQYRAKVRELKHRKV